MTMKTTKPSELQHHGADLTAALPYPHRPYARQQVEVVEGWAVLTHDRKRGDCTEAYRRARTPVQLLRVCPERDILSLLTPSLLTEGRFEFYAAGTTVRYCCYRCACQRIESAHSVHLPDPQDWMVYMLLDSVGYIENPAAPQEKL